MKKLFQLFIATFIFCALICTIPSTLLSPFFGQVVAQEISEEEQKRSEGDRLFHEAEQLYSLGDYQDALEKILQALAIYQDLDDPFQQADIALGLGDVYSRLGEYQNALTFHYQALESFRQMNEGRKESIALISLGFDYFALGDFPLSINFQKQALEIAREIEDLKLQGDIFRYLGNSYTQIGRLQEALESHEHALDIARKTDNPLLEAETLRNLCSTHIFRGELERAVLLCEQAIDLYAEVVDDPTRKALAFQSLGDALLEAKEFQSAIQSYEQALIVFHELGDNESYADTLNSLAGVYRELNQYQLSIGYSLKAINIISEAGNRSFIAFLYDNLSQTLVLNNQIELAILFLKKGININESIRADIAALPIDLQRTYSQGNKEAYHRLADLLLQRDRVLEAQQVLDLLKVQELEDYLNDVRGSHMTASGVEFWQPEQVILNQLTDRQQTAIKLGQELTELRQISEGDRTPSQQQRIDELVQLEEDLNRQFNDFLESEEILALVSQLSVTTQRQTLNPEDIAGLRETLGDLDAVLLYPLILEDRLELVITTPNSPPLRRTVEVSREELNRTILEFREVLQTPTRNATVPAQKLYRWLIEPLEDDLATADIDTIIYAPDGQLRYIPLAALHDGDRYLIERYAVNNITARSLTDLDAQPASDPKVLAGAFADQGQSYPVQIGQRNIDFRGLPFAGVEVENLVASLANITSFVDDDFSLDAVKSRLNEHDIIHFATHAAFVPGVPEDSFILFGNGDKPTLADIKNWSLHNVDLVVLSACQTGLGGFGNGEEILGLGYQFQRAGARAAIASLWQVSDGGTQTLMDAFYTALNNGHTKAEALRRAQLALFHNNTSILKPSDDRGIDIEWTDSETPLDVPTQDLEGTLSHPYYWAPFILIGNGL